jgi:hypothetical protein
MDYAITLKGFVEFPLAENNTAVSEFTFKAIETAVSPMDGMRFAIRDLHDLYENADEVVVEELHAVKAK